MGATIVRPAFTEAAVPRTAPKAPDGTITPRRHPTRRSATESCEPRGVVTSAALVMFGVFSLFGTASSLDLKRAGLGVAVAVVLDATVVSACCCRLR